MNNILYEIFDTLNYSIYGMERADKIITDEVHHLLEPYRDSLTDKQMEEIENILFNATFTAKRELFAVGFYFAIKLLKIENL